MKAISTMSHEQQKDSRNAKGQFLQGVSGNVAGRPKGSRNRVGEAFLEVLADDFEAHGREAVEQCRLNSPAVYIKVVASILPKELETTALVVEQPAMTPIEFEEIARRLLKEV